MEAVHAVGYFAADSREAYKAIGLRGFWMGYFASRSAALGSASPELVTALFFGFSPGMVRRALPDAWQRATPAEVLVSREDLAVRTLTPLLPDMALEPLANRLAGISSGLDLAGRPLAAEHVTVAGAGSPVARIWRAATVLQEYRGDGHVAAVVAAGLDGVEANASHAATGALPAEQRTHRGWSEDEWAAGLKRLRVRGWLDGDGTLTAAGMVGREAIERATDDAAARAFAGLSQVYVDELTADLMRLASGPVARGVPYPNAMGVLRP